MSITTSYLLTKFYVQEKKNTSLIETFPSIITYLLNLRKLHGIIKNYQDLNSSIF